MSGTKKEILKGEVFDVHEDMYHIRTTEGIYKIPVGVIDIYEGSLIKIRVNKYLKLHVPPENQGEEAQEVMDENSQDVLNGPTPIAEASPSPSISYEDGKHVADWPEKPCKMLIQLYAEKKKLVEERKIKTLKKMWDIIREQMMLFGYIYTSQQIESKWKSLERAYKNKIDNSKRTGRERQTCPYERELSDILLKRTTIIPPVTLDASFMQTSTETIRKCGLVDLEQASCSQNIVGEYNPIKKQTVSAAASQTTKVGKTAIRTEVQKLREAMERRFESREKQEEKSFKQRERLINELKRKNDLLEKFVDNISKGKTTD